MTDAQDPFTPPDPDAEFRARQLREFEAMQQIANSYALYLIYNSAKELIFAGISRRLQTSFGSQRTWLREMHTIKLVWFDTREEARAALDNLLAKRVPRYNAHHMATYRMIDEDGVERADLSRGRVPRGYCPHCGRLKERPHAAYCNPCFAEYHRKRKTLRANKWDTDSQQARLAATGRLDGRIKPNTYTSHLDSDTPVDPGKPVAVAVTGDPADE